MTTDPIPDSLTIRFAHLGDQGAPGTIRGSSFSEKHPSYTVDGKLLTPVPVTQRPIAAADIPGLLTTIFGAENAARIVTTESLQAQLDAALSDASDKAAQVAALQAQVKTLQAQVAAIGTPVPVASGGVLSKINAAFEAAIPPDARPAFAEKYAIVRILVQAGQMDMARHVIEQTPVPAELEAARAQLLAFFAPAS